MVRSKLQHPKNVMLKPSRAMGERLAILLDEIRLAVAWSRPSILLAVHQSKYGQERAIAALEGMLTELSIEVVRVMPVRNQSNFLASILQRSKPEKNIFFAQGLGTQKEFYDEMNLHREKIVENRLKLVFWLTLEEAATLSRRAPDFWAFRHRVVEFSAGRASRRNALPAGLLLWRVDDSLPEFDSLDEKISLREKALQRLPQNSESVIAHAEGIYDLSRLHWLKGGAQEAENMLRREIEDIGSFGLNEVKSLLVNGLAICCYDRGEYREALRLIEEALEAQPESCCLWTNHGVVCRAAGRSEKSFSSVNKAIRIDPASSAPRGVLGYISMSMGKFNAALLPLEATLRINPDSIPFHLALAVCRLRIGDMDKFEETMQTIPAARGNDTYLAVCRDGLMGNGPAALSRLTDLVKDEKVPSVFLKRDPSLHFIFGADALTNILQNPR